MWNRKNIHLEEKYAQITLTSIVCVSVARRHLAAGLTISGKKSH
jgi:hypothetical protein